MHRDILLGCAMTLGIKMTVESHDDTNICWVLYICVHMQCLKSYTGVYTHIHLHTYAALVGRVLIPEAWAGEGGRERGRSRSQDVLISADFIVFPIKHMLYH